MLNQLYKIISTPSIITEYTYHPVLYITVTTQIANYAKCCMFANTVTLNEGFDTVYYHIIDKYKSAMKLQQSDSLKYNI